MGHASLRVEEQRHLRRPHSISAFICCGMARVHILFPNIHMPGRPRQGPARAVDLHRTGCLHIDPLLNLDPIAMVRQQPEQLSFFALDTCTPVPCSTSTW